MHRHGSTCHLVMWATVLALTITAALAEPVVQATRADRPPVIDGKLDDAVWATGKPATQFLINNTDRPAQWPTAATVLYDDSALYVGVRCAEPDPDSLVTRPLPRDDGDVFRTDCIEVMLDPAGTQNDYYHIAVNASGSLADRACTQGGFIGDMSWDSTTAAASFIGPDHWSCELAIPYSCLGITPQVGASWRLNLCREKKNPAEDSSLSEQGAFNIASRFSELVGVDAKLAQYCYQIGEPVLSKTLKEGKLQLALQVPLRNDTGSAEPRLLDGWLVSPTGTVTSAALTIDPAVGQEQRFALGPFTVEEQGGYVCYLRVADPDTKKPLAYRKLALTIEYVPVTIRLVEPWYRDAMFASQNLENVVAGVEISLEEAARQGARLEVAIVAEGSDDPLAQQIVNPVQQMNRVTFPVAPLPEGKMQIRATLTGADGKVAAETSHPLRKLPPHPGEVWLGQDLQWHVDGKPFFLNGAWNYPEDFVPDYNVFTARREDDTLFLDATIMNELAYNAPSLETGELSDADEQMMRAYAREAMANPKLFAYYTSDEPEVGGIQAKVLDRVYEVFADEDPYHPVIISNDSMEGLRVYAHGADINGLHPYPVTLKDRPINDLTPVAAFVEGAVKFFEPMTHKQTIAYLHQGFNYGDYGAVNQRIPNYLEYRGQNLLALICGANGIIQFNRMVAHYPELYLGMPYLTKELAYLGPAMLGKTPETGPSADHEKLKLLLKEHDGQLTLLVSNADLAARDVRITVPGLSQRAQTLQVVSEGRTVQPQGDAWTDHFEPFAVHIYTTGAAPDLKSVDDIVAEIEQANQARRKPGNLVFQMFEGEGVVVTASSSKASQYRRPDNALWHVVDGIIDKTDHYQCLNWYDDTDGQSPDWLEIKLPQARPIGRVVVYPFEQSLRDYSVQAFVDGDWREVSKVEGQSRDEITHTFEPVTTDRVRLLVTAANGPNAIVTEVEAYER